MELRRYLPVVAAVAAILSLDGCAPYDVPEYTYYLVPCAPGMPLPPAAPTANECIASVPNYSYGYGYYPGYAPWYDDYAFGPSFAAPFGVFAFGHRHFHDHDHDHDHDGSHFGHGMHMGGPHGMRAGVGHAGVGNAGAGHAGGGHAGGGHGGGGHGGGGGHRG